MTKELRVAPPVQYCIDNPQPIDVAMALTNTCNHRCIFCQYHKVIPRSMTMDKQKGVDFLRQAYHMGIKECGFALIDEPFMSNDLEDYVLEAKKIGFEYVFFNTNGALAKRERIEILFANGLDSIKFSINAGKAETYKKVHGRDDFQKVLNNIRETAFLREKMNSKVRIFVSFAENSHNKEEGEVLKAILHNVVDKIYIVSATNQGGGMYEEAQRNILTKEETLWGRYKDNTKRSIIEGKICPYPFKRVSITAEGYLTACCVDAKNELVVADLNKMPLREAWNIKKIKELRSWHLTGNIPSNCKCYNCINNTNNAIEPFVLNKS